MPAALVEVAFMSNNNDLSLLKTEEFRQKAAQRYFQRYNELFKLTPIIGFGIITLN